MKVLATLLILLISFTTKGQSDHNKYPDYDLVVTKFFSSYSIKDIPSTAQIRFEKRPTGWHVAVVDFSGEQEIIKSELFWNRKRNKFRKLDFEKLKDKEENQNEIEKYKQQWSNIFYRTFPYQGYIGWDWDIIQEFEGVTNLSDTMLYALGVAYSNFASNLLNNNSGWADPKHQFDLPPGKNSLSKDQLEKYRFYRHRAIEKLRQVAELNPKFETIVGAIGIKASNDYLNSFLELRVYQNEEEASKEIVHGLYTEILLSAARNYLHSCAPNAILFTNGDNDTYPLLYVQSKYGVRKDVMVVNISLLNTDRYINSLRDKILDAPGLPISFTPDQIAGSKREVILIENEDNESWELNRLITFLKNDDNVKNYGNIDYYYVPSNKFSLQQQQNNMEWEVGRRYFFRSNLMVLDILATNKWERPVYFAITLGDDAYFGMTEYFQLEGLAYRLVSTGQKESESLTGTVNTSIMYDNLMNKFDWSGIQTPNSHEKLFGINYRVIFHRLADALIKENKVDSAEAVLDKCIELIPNDIIYYESLMISIMEDYYKINEFEKGNEIGRKLIYNLKNDIDNFSDMTLVLWSDDKAEDLKRIRELAVRYKQGELVGEIDE